MSDYIAHHDYRFDNLKERRLADILSGGPWMESVCANLYALREKNEACRACEWFGHCGGGCRALAILDSTEKNGKMDYFGCDPLACLFYKGGWYERVKERLKAYKHI